MTEAGVDAIATRRFAREILMRHRADPDEAGIVTDILLWCEMRGLSSQGFCRIPVLVKRLGAGGIVSPCSPEFKRLGGAVGILEGNGGFGQYLGTIAVRRAVELARGQGLSAVAVRNSNHFGAAGYYALLAAEKGLIAIVTSNAYPTVAALGGRRPVLGTNPLAVAVPRQNQHPLIIDMGTTFGSMTATVDRAARAGSVDEGVAVDQGGKPVTDAQKIRDGAALPLGARGFALGLAVEILSGVLTGSGYGKGLRSFYRHPDRPGGLGHLIVCLEVEAFMPAAQFMDRLEDLIGFVKASDAIDPQRPIRLPGERRWETDRRNRKDGTIPLDAKTRTALDALAGPLGLVPPWT